MPKTKKTAKEKRIEAKKKRLEDIAEKIKQKSSEGLSGVTSEGNVSENELKDASKVINGNHYIKREKLEADSNLIKIEKSMLQQELNRINNPEIKDIPDFLLNPEMSEERKDMMDKINFLLKHRFSLIAIADILECNDYDRLDEIIEHKEKIYKLTEKYSQEDGLKTIRLFSGLKRAVGDEYSRTYSEQEERVKTLVKYISDGKYFNADEDPEIMIEDVISKVIDHPDFNLACQIEAEFLTYEIDRAITILSDLSSRSELQDLLDDLRRVYISIDERSHAYKIMDKLINNRKNDRIIIDDDKEKDEDNGR